MVGACVAISTWSVRGQFTVGPPAAQSHALTTLATLTTLTVSPLTTAMLAMRAVLVMLATLTTLTVPLRLCLLCACSLDPCTRLPSASVTITRAHSARIASGSSARGSCACSEVEYLVQSRVYKVGILCRTSIVYRVSGVSVRLTYIHIVDGRDTAGAPRAEPSTGTGGAGAGARP